MSDTIEIPIRELPLDLTKNVNDHIRLFSVTMLMSDEDDSNAIPCAGSLSSIGETKGIITARHAWEEMIKHKYLFIMLGKKPHVIGVELLDAFVPPDRVKIYAKIAGIDTDIPDIALIKLPSPSITHIEAVSKVFYSIDKRVDDGELNDFLTNPIGYYALFGAPFEWVDFDGKTVPSFIYNTYISEYIKIEDWDYQIMGLNLDENPNLPKSFEGVSGGGIWKIKFMVSEDQSTYFIQDLFNDVALCGVNFYQTAPKGRQIIGHGPFSIYNCLYVLARSNQ